MVIGGTEGRREGKWWTYILIKKNKNVYMHVCVHTYRCVQVQVCEAHRTMLHVFLYHFPHHLVGQGLSTAMSVQSDYSGWPASSKDLLVFISQPSARLKMSALIPSCYMAAEGQTLTTVILCGRHFADCAISPVLKNFNFRS